MGTPHLIVDGYNILHAWQELRHIAKADRDAACQRLADMLRPIHATSGHRVTLVFDGRGGKSTIERDSPDQSFSLLWTATGLSADALIERIVLQSPHPTSLTVATQDNLVATAARASGAIVITPAALRDWLQRAQMQQSHAIARHTRHAQTTRLASEVWQALEKPDP